MRGGNFSAFFSRYVSESVMHLNGTNVSGTIQSKTNFQELVLNISKLLEEIHQDKATAAQNANHEGHYDDSKNAYLYIIFVLMFYSFSIVVLMVKYIRREREGAKLEYYYNEFVKRDWYKDKNLYDSKGRRIRYNEDGTSVARIARRPSKHYDDPGMFDLSDDDSEDSDEDRVKKGPGKGQKSVSLSVGAASIFAEHAAIGLVASSIKKQASLKLSPICNRRKSCSGAINTTKDFINTGARPKKVKIKSLDEEEEPIEVFLPSGPSKLALDEEEAADVLPFLPSGPSKLAFCKVDESCLQMPQKSCLKRATSYRKPPLTKQLPKLQSQSSNDLHSSFSSV